MESYHQLTQHERYIIASMRRQRNSVPQIADRLGRHRSTIYREVERNKTTYNGHYGAHKAHSYAVARGRRCRRGPQYKPQELARVDALLRQWWSPQRISGVQIVCMPTRHYSGRGLTDRSEPHRVSRRPVGLSQTCLI